MLGLSDNSIKDDFEDEDEDEHESTDEALEENKCLKEDENEEELPAVKADIRAETEVADDEEPFRGAQHQLGRTRRSSTNT